MVSLLDLFGKPKSSEVLDLESGKMSKDILNDYSRRYIAYALLALLSVIVVMGLGELITINDKTVDNAKSGGVWAADAKADGDRLIAVLNVVFGPIVTLLGTATGFYFGTKGNDPNPSGPDTSPAPIVAPLAPAPLPPPPPVAPAPVS